MRLTKKYIDLILISSKHGNTEYILCYLEEKLDSSKYAYMILILSQYINHSKIKGKKLLVYTYFTLL